MDTEKRFGGTVTQPGFLLAFALLVGIGSLGFALRRGPESHESVAPWDYPDKPNSHPIAHAGPVIPFPKNVIEAKDGIAVAPDGITVRLTSISKGNTENWEHCWNQAGGPLSETSNRFIQGVPDTPEKTDGRFRELRFEFHTGKPIEDVSYIGYVPDGALQGLTAQEKPLHGWDYPQSFRFQQYTDLHKAGVYVDDPSADKFLFGLASGAWKTIDTPKMLLTKPPYKNQVAASGPWGKAIVTYAEGEGREVYSKHSLFNELQVSLNPPNDLVDQELRLHAYDKDGVELVVPSRQNQASIRLPDLPRIASLEIQARPYTFLEFKDLHFDPLPSLWKNIVWGPDQPTDKVQIGDVTAELLGVASTKPGDQDWSRQSYVFNSLYTVDGHIWRDHPESLNTAGGPKVEIAPTFDPDTFKMRPPRALPQPWVATLKFKSSSVGEEKPAGRIEVLGSNSDQPGEDLHADWNLTPLNWESYGQVKTIPDSIWASFALKPHTKYAQFRFEMASGAWKKAVEVVPDPDEIKSRGPEYRVYTLEVGTNVRVAMRNPGGQYVDRVCADANLDGQETRVVVRLKSGKRIPLAATSYRRIDRNHPLDPSYDMDRDATETEGDMIALTDVAAFEIESRPIKTAYLVFKMPE